MKKRDWKNEEYYEIGLKAYAEGLPAEANPHKDWLRYDVDDESFVDKCLSWSAGWNDAWKADGSPENRL